MNNLQKAVIESTGNKGSDARCASTFQKQMEMFHERCGKAFHTCSFLFLFLYIDTCSKHYIAMIKSRSNDGSLEGKFGLF